MKVLMLSIGMALLRAASELSLISAAECNEDEIKSLEDTFDYLDGMNEDALNCIDEVAANFCEPVCLDLFDKFANELPECTISMQEYKNVNIKRLIAAFSEICNGSKKADNALLEHVFVGAESISVEVGSSLESDSDGGDKAHWSAVGVVFVSVLTFIQ